MSSLRTRTSFFVHSTMSLFLHISVMAFFLLCRLSQPFFYCSTFLFLLFYLSVPTFLILFLFLYCLVFLSLQLAHSLHCAWVSLGRFRQFSFQFSSSTATVGHGRGRDDRGTNIVTIYERCYDIMVMSVKMK